ncbi:porin family protein [Hymenobacter nivis]|uniref:PorT family protein n=1 Tax=Hymenobacter nivis TaxID=1850093 RepID=A0A502GX54_9BACT|nr:porin family protein [Hymenobacter nivis]TPG66474.1 PorT family protein [Hymenobacter nivis]
MQSLFTLALGAALLAGVAPASAQTTYRLGLRGGLNRALSTTDPASNQSNLPAGELQNDKSALLAWQAGVAFEARFGKLAFQPALLFSQKGNEFSTGRYTGGVFGATARIATGTTRTNWLELPLNVVYTLHGDHGLQLFAGPYVALAVGGRQTGTYRDYLGPAIDTWPVDFDNRVAYGTGTCNRRLDAGVNFGVGYRQGPLQVQLGYGLGLRNLYQAPPLLFAPSSTSYDPGRGFADEKAYSRVAQLTGTYFFSL